MKPRAYVAIIGLVLIAVALFIGFSTVTVPYSDGSPASCGSPFSPIAHPEPDFLAPSDYVQPRASCPGAVSSKRTLVWVVLGAGILVALGATIRTRKETPA